MQHTYLGLAEPHQGTSGHFHTSSTGRALLFAQDRRWKDSTVIFVIALLVVMLLHFKRESHAPFYATALLLVLTLLPVSLV